MHKITVIILPNPDWRVMGNELYSLCGNHSFMLVYHAGLQVLSTASHYWPLDAVEGIHELFDKIGNRPGYVNGSNISMCTAKATKATAAGCMASGGFSACSNTHFSTSAAVFTRLRLHVRFI